MKWIDVNDVATALAEQYPKVDPTQVRFTELRDKVIELKDFKDERDCNERILEAIQQCWIDEVE
ncbi:Fe-S assembly protein IscX [Motilimonas pumila]|uniref:Fe-S assembly protein IscX n=2 Tax=Motilimonas pumila TaxID=2303987 RepID=A0A418YEN9_9GAMM|nr:Fe-S assembly protein IscX [Motilimonas pumila]